MADELRDAQEAELARLEGEYRTLNSRPEADRDLPRLYELDAGIQTLRGVLGVSTEPPETPAP